jgi:amidophosphoribosyltransferase
LISRRFPNVYGIDMPSRRELVAYDKSDEEIARVIGADKVIFQVGQLYKVYISRYNCICFTCSKIYLYRLQKLEDLVASCSSLNPDIKRFDCSVFDGEYITGSVTPTYLEKLESLRNDIAKGVREMQDSRETIGLHNACNGYKD